MEELLRIRDGLAACMCGISKSEMVGLRIGTIERHVKKQGHDH